MSRTTGSKCPKCDEAVDGADLIQDEEVSCDTCGKIVRIGTCWITIEKAYVGERYGGPPEKDDAEEIMDEDFCSAECLLSRLGLRLKPKRRKKK